eukprot:CAMPEP_0118706418 /NCGR_PEP_ID=MMETSP0800-20121206/20545_1 /TAXON_ID=210618 ORGANISM="Striatella unipunctata, Strain CCMP2910" /NCGR_SAMPLE_ID=MMETSP0800 /ASSEMBLY_ACC=CAM_ASM_000638 /LENGTH=319 /DNA_ID=CAMNT_0006608947 /DNA_START=223 /DNA_END=1182 /DNA_ORIENTATION=-
MTNWSLVLGMSQQLPFLQLTPPHIPFTNMYLSSDHEQQQRQQQQQEEDANGFEISYNQGKKMLRYLGRIGPGNRSIRAVAPLPSPCHRHQQHRHRFVVDITCGPLNVLSSLFRRHHQAGSGLCRGINVLNKEKPMVFPIVTADPTRNQLNINLSPRLVSYYEISIHADTTNGVGDRDGYYNNECIAIGLATEKFQLHNRMPGWDQHSYGYHGDDGGVFHESGESQNHYEEFGAGDVVGCGIDYVRDKIFFTLNGKFLGCAFTLDTHDKLLFPTIGVDSSAWIHTNFGQEPFSFDLLKYAESHKSLISAALGEASSCRRK